MEDDWEEELSLEEMAVKKAEKARNKVSSDKKARRKVSSDKKACRKVGRETRHREGAQHGKKAHRKVSLSRPE